MPAFVILIALLYSTISQAAPTTTLTVDRAVMPDVQLSFPEDGAAEPKASELVLVNYVLMSSEVGERWAVITLQNPSTGHRVFDQDQLLALFANGERKHPQTIKYNFEGQETASLTVNFGLHKFPILSIYNSSSRPSKQ